jgi:hypothetical protein
MLSFQNNNIFKLTLCALLMGKSRRNQEQTRTHKNKYAGERPKGPTLAELEAANPGYLEQELQKAREKRARISPQTPTMTSVPRRTADGSYSPSDSLRRAYHSLYD